MIRGLLFEADELELALRTTLTGDTARLNHMRTTTRLASEYLNTTRDSTTGTWQIVPGIELVIEIDRFYTGFGWDAGSSATYHVRINSTDIVHSESESYLSDTERSCQLRFFAWRVENHRSLGLGVSAYRIEFDTPGGTTVLYDGDDHSGARIGWWVGKYVDITDDFVPTPAHLPLLGLFPTLYSEPFDFQTAAFTLSDPSTPVRDIYQWDMVNRGGWRYRIGGSWHEFPVHLVVDPSDGGSCCEISHPPVLSASSTATGRIETYYRVEKTTHSSFPPGDEEIWNASAQITLTPNLERGIERNEQYGALWERFAFPRARVLNDVYCYYAENAVPVCTTDTTSYRTIYAAEPEMVRRVTNATSELERVFDPPLQTPYRWQSNYTRLWGLAPGDLRERQEQKIVAYPVTDDAIDPHYEYRHATIGQETQGRVEYLQTWLHPHWSILLTYRDWQLGLPLRTVESEQYWLKIHQQFCGDITALPETQRTNERLLPLAEPLLQTSSDDKTWRKLLTGHKTSFVGLSRFGVDSVTPIDEVAITESSAWSASNATLTHGASLTVTPSTAGTVTVTLDLEAIERLSAQLCDTIVVNWSGGSIDSATVTAVNQQSTAQTLGTAAGSYQLDRASDAHYSGSWGQDYSAGAINVLSESYAETPTDLDSSGRSSDTLSDTERITTPLLFAGRGLKQLEFVFEVSDTPAITLSYPIFQRASTRWTPVPETAHSAALPATNNTYHRYGQWDWWSGSGLASIPALRPVHSRSTALDYLAYRDRILRATAPDTARIDTWYPSEQGGLADLLGETYALIVQARDSANALIDNTIRAWLVNSLREVPPLVACPRKARGADWLETGDWGLWVYTLGHVKRYYLATQPLQLYRVEFDGGGTETARTLLSTTSSDYATGGDWQLTEHSLALTNEEVITRWDGTTVNSPRWYLASTDALDWSRVTPFHGYSALLQTGAGKSGAGISYDVSSAQRHLRALSDSGEVWIGYATDISGREWTDQPTGISGIQPCVRWSNWDTRAKIWLVYQAAGGAIELRSTTEGGSWSMATTITTSGEYPALVATRDGRLLIYWVASGDIRGVVYDQVGSEIVSEFTAVTGVDNSPLAVDEFTLSSGGWRVNLLYRVSGALTVSTSSDGITFS